MLKLKELNLCNNGIKAEGIKMLVKGDWRTLKSLNIDKNSIGNEGVRFLTRTDWKNL